MLATLVFGVCSTLLMGSTSGQSYVQSASFVHTGPISVTEYNGVSRYVINGTPLDLSRATVISENNELRVLRPYEVPQARVTVYKHRNAVSIDYMGHHFEGAHHFQVSG